MIEKLDFSSSFIAVKFQKTHFKKNKYAMKFFELTPHILLMKKSLNN